MEAAYTMQALQEMLGISRSAIMGFVDAGFVTPVRGPRNAYRFGFQDVVLLRTARTLRRAHFSAAKIRKALLRLRTLLPAEVPLSGLRITAMGDDVAVRENGQAMVVETGQLLFDFEVVVTAGAVLSFPGTDEDRAPHEEHEARTSSRGHLERGARWVDSGDSEDALAVYEEGIAAFPADAALQFNRAVVLEDLGRVDDAVAAYQRCLDLEADFADAHWNLARLHEMRGVGTLALRHFSAYRRLSR